MENTFIVSSVLSFIIAAILGPILIPILHRMKFGQEIREIGPSWHKKKSGTPTMGGFIFIIPIVVCTLVFAKSRTLMGICLMLFALSFGLVGFIDDYIKIVKKRNLGLTENQKFLLQLIFSVVFIIISIYGFGLIDTRVVIPVWKKSVDLGILYIPFALFVLIGCTNSVNLTDGVDGLAASVTVVVCAFLAIMAYEQNEYAIAMVNLISASALVGFLIYPSQSKGIYGRYRVALFGWFGLFIGTSFKKPHNFNNYWWSICYRNTICNTSGCFV